MVNKTKLKYTNEFILNEDGIKCRVLDVSNIDFSQSLVGRKIKETLVLKANGNERIKTINSDGLIESTYITSFGDAIFVNNEKDIYVPKDFFGSAWKFDSIEDYGYEITSDVFLHNGSSAVKVKSIKQSKVLPYSIVIPTCIKDAFGPGMHQFLFKGATLKKDIETGRVKGIDQVVFDNTWEVINEEKT